MVQLLWETVWQLLQTFNIDYHVIQQFRFQVYTHQYCKQELKLRGRRGRIYNCCFQGKSRILTTLKRGGNFNASHILQGNDTSNRKENQGTMALPIMKHGTDFSNHVSLVDSVNWTGYPNLLQFSEMIQVALAKTGHLRAYHSFSFELVTFIDTFRDLFSYL